jgi:hypothetical protein
LRAVHAVCIGADALIDRPLRDGAGASIETAKRAAAALDTFNAETRETVNVPELVH